MLERIRSDRDRRRTMDLARLSTKAKDQSEVMSKFINRGMPLEPQLQGEGEAIQSLQQHMSSHNIINTKEKLAIKR